MRRLRSLADSIFDWRNGATIVAGVLVALLAVVTLDGISGRRQAISALQAQSGQALSAQRAATARITELRDEIATLQANAHSNGARIAELVTEVHALEGQIRAMGGRPVVTEPRDDHQQGTTTTTTTVRPSATPTSSTSTTTTTRPPSTTTTTRCLVPGVLC